MVAKADKRKQKIYHIFIGVITVLFIGNFILQDKNAKDDNLKRYYSGTIQNIVIIDGFKGVNLKINGSWYNLSYTKDFENINYIGCKIEKKINESGVWVESKKGSDHFIYYNVSSSIIEDRQYINRLIRHENKNK